MNVEIRNSVFRLTVSRAFHSTRKFETEPNYYRCGNFQVKLKSEPFNGKLWKFHNENQMERKLSRKMFSKTWVYLRWLSYFSDFLFSATYFGHDHGEVDIACKNVGDQEIIGDLYSKMTQCFPLVSCL